MPWPWPVTQRGANFNHYRPAPLAQWGRARCCLSGTFCEHSCSRRNKKSSPYLETPTQTATEPTLPVYSEARAPTSTLVGTFVSEGPISISLLWFPYLPRAGFWAQAEPKGAAGDMARSRLGTAGRRPGQSNRRWPRSRGLAAAELLGRPRGSFWQPPPRKAPCDFFVERPS